MVLLQRHEEGRVPALQAVGLRPHPEGPDVLPHLLPRRQGAALPGQTVHRDKVGAVNHFQEVTNKKLNC